MDQLTRYGNFFYQLIPSKFGDYCYVALGKAACSTVKVVLWEEERERSAEVGPLGVATVHAQNQGFDSPWISLADPDFYERLQRMSREGLSLFTVVRNPFARALSAWRNKILLKDEDGDFYLERIGWRLARLPTFVEFLERIDGQPADRMNHHWRPLSETMLLPLVGYDAVYSVENLSSDLSAMRRRYFDARTAHKAEPKLNVSGAEARLNKEYTTQAVELVRRIYARDFAAFGYGPDPSLLSPDLAILGTAATGGGIPQDLFRAPRWELPIAA